MIKNVLSNIPHKLSIPLGIYSILYAIFLPETIYYALGLYLDLWFPVLKTIVGYFIAFALLGLPIVNILVIALLTFQSFHILLKIIFTGYDFSVHPVVTAYPAIIALIIMLNSYLFDSYSQNSHQLNDLFTIYKKRLIHRKEQLLQVSKLQFIKINDFFDIWLLRLSPFFISTCYWLVTSIELADSKGDKWVGLVHLQANILLSTFTKASLVIFILSLLVHLMLKPISILSRKSRYIIVSVVVTCLATLDILNVAPFHIIFFGSKGLWGGY